MRIKARCPSGREIYIVQFVRQQLGLFAVTVDDKGNISELPAELLTVIDIAYVKTDRY